MIAATPVVYSSGGVTVTSAFESVGNIAGLAYLMTASARQPELLGSLQAVAAQFTGPMAFNDAPLVMAARAFFAGAVLDGIARQPELGTTLVGLALDFVGPPPALPAQPNLDILGIYVRSRLIAAVERQPEMQDMLAQALYDLTGYDFRIGD